MSQPIDVAVVIPGIMGSCLEYSQSGTAQPIWTESFLDNYKRLANNPSVFKYDERVSAAAPRVMKFFSLVNLPVVGPFWRTSLFGALFEYLKIHRDFNHSLGVVEFPYDWRESLLKTAQKLRISLNSSLKIQVQKPRQRVQLSIITHSMGGLVARVALVDKQLHPSNIRRIVHIAPPLLGSATAFRSLFGGSALPFLNEFVTFCHSRKNGRLALTNLQQVMASFPSMYQLMPPQSEKFLYVGQGQTINPLAPAETVISKRYKEAGCAVHHRLLQSIKKIGDARLSTYTIYGANGELTTDEHYKVFIEKDKYEMLDPVPYLDEVGDGTVTSRSCRFDNRDSADFREVVGEKHAYMCDSKNVIAVLGTIM